MTTLRICCAQLNPTVGDVAANTATILDTYRRCDADLFITGELATCGYPPEDLLADDEFINRCDTALADLVAQLDGPAAVIGAPRRVPAASYLDATTRRLTNAAYVTAGRRVVGVADKTLLANYAIFDEARHFRPGGTPTPITVPTRAGDVRLGVLICEDLWQRHDEHLDPAERTGGARPVADQLCDAGAELLVVINASPHWDHKHTERLTVAAATAARCGVPLVYVNIVGAADGILFDGRSFALDATGTLCWQSAAWVDTTDTITVDIDSGAVTGPHTPAVAAGSWAADTRAADTWEADTWAALCTGLADYVDKGGFDEVVIGLSGGIDSAVVTTLAADALGARRVHAVAMPGPYSSASSVTDAAELAEHLGVRFDVIDIVDTYHAARAALYDGPLAGQRGGVTTENLQARIRGMILMGLSNAGGGLVLACGNKSELAVGYATLYGDMVGGLAVIGDIAKTRVYDLARWRNTLGGAPIPTHTIERAPSAELAADQRDDDTLPDYPTLDAILAAYIEARRSPDDIVAAGIDRCTVEAVVALVDANEYKRRQAPPIIKVTATAFGRDRRLPLAPRRRTRRCTP